MTRANFMVEVKRHGAEVDDNVESMLIVDLPAGRTWKSNGSHSVCIALDVRRDGSGYSMPDAYAALITDMRPGVDESCEAASAGRHCDVCCPHDCEGNYSCNHR